MLFTEGPVENIAHGWTRAPHPPLCGSPSPRLRGEGRGVGSRDASDIKIMRLALSEQYWGLPGALSS